jgi:hypothetical protein
MLLAGSSFTLVLALAGAAAAQEGAPPPSSPRDAPWEVSLGYRGGVVKSAGFYPFSTDDYFSQSSLQASRVVAWRGRFALAVGAAWDFGTAGATARGARTGLVVHRVTAPVTLRYALARWWSVFVRVAPGAAHESAHVDEASAPATLVKSAWVPSGDATAGVAWAYADSKIGEGEHPFTLVWSLTAEGGYGWSGNMALAMSPDLGSGDARQVGTTDLGTLALSGGFGRIGLAVGF